VRRAFLLLFAALAACGPAPVSSNPPGPPLPVATTPTLSPPPIELVETFPVETTLDHQDIADAAETWPKVIDRAQKRLDISHFYISNTPGSVLEPTLAAIERAAARGVKVRLLVDRKFYDRYPESVDRLANHKNIAVRKLDLRARDAVQHAKYFLVDGREAFVGSQNMDWRALQHIHEMGALTRLPPVAEALSRVFDADWAKAGDEPAPKFEANLALPIKTSLDGSEIRILPAASPADMLPAGVPWDLPEIVARIDAAKKSVDVEVLGYKTKDRSGKIFVDLDDALRRAAGRGAAVRLLIGEWSKRPASLEPLRALARVPNIEIKFLAIPQTSTGFIPFARVAHAKYMVVDSEAAWIGSENWEGDYFTASRNVSLFVFGSSFAGKLGRVFEGAFSSPYAERLDPDRTYEPPRIE